MNYEEKKAIEKINEKMEFRKNCMKSYEEDKCYTSFYYELKSEVEMYKTLLNLIEKQQKENQQLKRKLSDMYQSTGEYEKAKSIMTKELREYIPKSKIQDKIDELENVINEFRYSPFMYNKVEVIKIVITELKKLLESEE